MLCVTRWLVSCCWLCNAAAGAPNPFRLSGWAPRIQLPHLGLLLSQPDYCFVLLQEPDLLCPVGQHLATWHATAPHPAVCCVQQKQTCCIQAQQHYPSAAGAAAAGPLSQAGSAHSIRGWPSLVYSPAAAAAAGASPAAPQVQHCCLSAAGAAGLRPALPIPAPTGPRLSTHLLLLQEPDLLRLVELYLASIPPVEEPARREPASVMALPYQFQEQVVREDVRWDLLLPCGSACAGRCLLGCLLGAGQAHRRDMRPSVPCGGLLAALARVTHLLDHEQAVCRCVQQELGCPGPSLWCWHSLQIQRPRQSQHGGPVTGAQQTGDCTVGEN